MSQGQLLMSINASINYSPPGNSSINYWLTMDQLPGYANTYLIEEFDDGIFIKLGGKPASVEYHEGHIQVWRDEEGRIVAVDVIYEDVYEEEREGEKNQENNNV